MPFMQLAIQVAGALAAGGLALVFAQQAGMRGRQSVGVIAVVPVVTACLLAAPALRDSIDGFLDAHKANAALTPRDVRLGNGAGIGADVDFLGWAGRHVAEDETFGVVIENTEEAGSLQQWVLFQLAPRVAVEPPAAADWIIFYDADPSEYAGLNEVDVYKRGFAIARVRHAR